MNFPTRLRTFFKCLLYLALISVFGLACYAAGGIIAKDDSLDSFMGGGGFWITSDQLEGILSNWNNMDTAPWRGRVMADVAHYSVDALKAIKDHTPLAEIAPEDLRLMGLLAEMAKRGDRDSLAISMALGKSDSDIRYAFEAEHWSAYDLWGGPHWRGTYLLFLDERDRYIGFGKATAKGREEIKQITTDWHNQKGK